MSEDQFISRQAAIEALQGLVSRFEQILRDIRETKIDDSVCGMCEYDGAYMGQSGDWCNECPGFDKNDCFKLSEECKKRWLDSVELPSAQHEIIRCRDCRFYEWMSNRVPEEQTWFCHNWNAETGKDDYCSYAERRQNETAQ